MPSILIDVIAAPGRDVNNVLRNAFPIVTAYPLSNGSATILEKLFVLFVQSLPIWFH